MSIEIKVPTVGESITSGILSAWHKKDGDAVKSGDVLFTLETDKVSTEVTAEKAGTLRIKAAEGAEVKIGEVVALIEDEKVCSCGRRYCPCGKRCSTCGGPGSKTRTHPRQKRKESRRAEARSQSRTKIRPGPAPAEPEPPKPSAPAPAPVPAEVPKASSEPATPPSSSTGERFTRKKLSPLRRKIATQLVMAQQTAAILTTFNECDLTGVMDLRARVQDSFQKQHGVKLGFMSFFIKATVAALKEIPAVNGRMDGDDFIQNLYYDIGVAVGTERGLIVPVIRDADQKSFAQIEKDLADYATKAREGKIKIEDLQGGVFTISNGGVYGSLLSTPILNPPQSGILGMHKIQQRPIALNGQVVIRPMMYLALSYDHRVVDGKEAVTFLVRVKDCIEDPARLLLDV